MALDSHDGFEKGIHVQLPKEIWAVAGCSDFFQNLNFALSQTEAHSPWVTLSAPAVKLERKLLHFASTSIAAVCAGKSNLVRSLLDIHVYATYATYLRGIFFIDYWITFLSCCSCFSDKATDVTQRKTIETSELL